MYVDHAATTPVRSEVLEAMLPYFAESFGNPSSLHGPGRDARRAIDQARKSVAEVLGCFPDEIVFTASGSEGANLAIKNGALCAETHRRHVVTTQVEHHAVLESCRWLGATQGFRVTQAPVDSSGVLDLDAFGRAVTEQTALVSVMYANNEVGTIQPVEEVVRIARGCGVVVHVDAVQAAGSLDMNVGRLGVDTLSISAHKLYGPKGVGALYVRRGTRLMAHVHGGGQERGHRAGTENVPGIVGLAKALVLAQSERPTESRRIEELTHPLLAELPARVPGCQTTGHPTSRLPGHASFVFEDVEIASVLLGLDRDGIWASSGSACTSSSSEPSHVLQAMGIPRRSLFGALRLTLGRDNTPADVQTLLETIPPLIDGARTGRLAAQQASQGSTVFGAGGAHLPTFSQN